MTEKAKCKYCTDEIDGSDDICDHCEACVAQEKHRRKYMRNRHAWGILFSLILLLFCVNELLMPDYDNWVLYLTGLAVFSLGFQIHQFFVWARFVYEEYDPWDGMADDLNKGSLVSPRENVCPNCGDERKTIKFVHKTFKDEFNEDPIGFFVWVIAFSATLGAFYLARANDWHEIPSMIVALLAFVGVFKIYVKIVETFR